MIAPNNNLTPELIIEVWRVFKNTHYFKCYYRDFTASTGTIAVFKIRENKLPTKHKFNLCKQD